MRDCVVVGVGQLGRLFGSAALARGVRVTPLVRNGAENSAAGDDYDAVFASVTAGAPILVTVGERDLAGAIARVPRERAGDVVLVQNELFPDVWRALLPSTAPAHVEPTVVVVWSNVKKGRPVEIGRPTAAFGEHAAFIGELSAAADIPFTLLASHDDLVDELVAKYAFLLAVNALGLEKQRTVGEWLDADAARVDDVIAGYVRLAEARVGRARPTGERSGAAGVAATAKAREAMQALRAMPAAGRTAKERVERARAEAARLGVVM